MKKKIIVGIIAILFILVIIYIVRKSEVSLPVYENALSDTADILQAEVTVDASQNLGEMPEVFRAGLMGSWWEDLKSIKSEVKDLKEKPIWRLHLSIVDTPGGGELTKPAGFEDAFVNWLRTNVNPKIKKFQDHGYQVIVSFTTMPRWLALYPSDDLMPGAPAGWAIKWRYSPPKDYEKFDNLIKLLVQTQKQDGLNVHYIVWDEPNWMFYGTERQFLELHAHAVRAIKEVDRNIKLGALGVGNWKEKKDSNCPAEETGLPDGECLEYSQSFVKSLIDYSASHNLPLDFIDWHFSDMYSIEEEVNTTRKWLREAKLPDTIFFTIGEWVFSPVRDIESTEKASSFVIPLLKSFSENGIKWHSATSIHDQSGWKDRSWEHVGFFSSDGVIKPKWNSFKAIDKLIHESNRIHTLVDNEFVSTIASKAKDKSKVKVLISNFIPEDDMAKHYIKNRMSEYLNGYYGDALQPFKICREEGSLPKECISLLPSELIPFFNCLVEGKNGECLSLCPEHLLKVRQKTTEELQYNKQYLKEVSFIFENLPFTGKAILTTYTIDKDQANSCRYNKKTETGLWLSDTECGLRGAVDRAVKQAKKEAKKKAKQEVNFQEVYGDLFYYCKHTTPSGKTITISTCVDKINNLSEVSLEGSKQIKGITINDGSYTETITIQPYSVVLVEISKR